jgi:hypothetical protein
MHKFKKDFLELISFGHFRNLIAAFFSSIALVSAYIIKLILQFSEVEQNAGPAKAIDSIYMLYFIVLVFWPIIVLLCHFKLLKISIKLGFSLAAILTLIFLFIDSITQAPTILYYMSFLPFLIYITIYAGIHTNLRNIKDKIDNL